ncbi:Replication protein A OB domain [Phytophthora infestans]|uniref:Replication protein A OB domain n=1 Tax=Phytophthora infestans TaxID=4787 RepID=A0A833SRN8_PHYIN|nr:Replication protein A OB domain [Phytophthora infestans]KAF4127827.1 Replication protein A OB domain [Phytophthora infestans]
MSVPIRDLSPSLGVEWSIIARVVSLSPLRSWSNTKGSGKVLAAELADSDDTHNRACAFNQLAESATRTLKLDNVYRVRDAVLRRAKQIADDGTVGHPKYHFTGIRELATVAESSIVGVVGVSVKGEEVDYVVRKSGHLIKKREVTFVDTSNVSVLLTLWNEFADVDGPGSMIVVEPDIPKRDELHNYRVTDSDMNHVIAAHNGSVVDFNGRGIGTRTGSFVAVDPDIPELASVSGCRQEPTAEAEEGEKSVNAATKARGKRVSAKRKLNENADGPTMKRQVKY